MKYLTLILLSFILVFSSNGQGSELNDDRKTTLEEQFNQLYKKSNNYQVYKVVKKTELNKYWNNVSDSLNMMQSKIALSSKEIKDQAARIRDLEEEVASSNGAIEELEGKLETISFLGGDWDKQSYKSTMWTIVFILLGLCAILFLRFIRSNKITRSAKKQVSDLEAEFDSYRKTAIQKEQEIKRKLQDYINKVSELTGV